MGHKIDQQGIYPNGKKVRAIENAPEPNNVQELRAYLGLINYYGRYLLRLSTTLAALYDLLRKGKLWTWGKEQRKAFELSKSALQSTNLLVHFDPEKELTLACDASPHGMGAVLSHRHADGTDRPIAFASRTLTKAERCYAQIDKRGTGSNVWSQAVPPVCLW